MPAAFVCEVLHTSQVKSRVTLTLEGPSRGPFQLHRAPMFDELRACDADTPYKHAVPPRGAVLAGFPLLGACGLPRLTYR